jgi:hypothetical protein
MVCRLEENTTFHPAPPHHARIQLASQGPPLQDRMPIPALYGRQVRVGDRLERRPDHLPRGLGQARPRKDAPRAEEAHRPRGRRKPFLPHHQPRPHAGKSRPPTLRKPAKYRLKAAKTPPGRSCSTTSTITRNKPSTPGGSISPKAIPSTPRPPPSSI